MTDPVLTEIEIQLKLALQALTNVSQFVARLNAAQDVETPSDTDPDGDAPMVTYEDVAVTTTSPPNGGRNGRREKQRR